MSFVCLAPLVEKKYLLSLCQSRAISFEMLAAPVARFSTVVRRVVPVRPVSFRSVRAVPFVRRWVVMFESVTPSAELARNILGIRFC